MSQPATILIVDDEPDVREVLQEYFAANGFEVLAAADARAARALLPSHRADVALIDINMPGEDGLSLARHLREHYQGLAIVMLTSASTVVDRIVGLEVGADDYVSKPFDPRELLARIRSVLRRTSAPEIERRSMKSSESAPAAAPAQRIRMGRCTLDLAAHRLLDAQGNDIPITPLEFDLLKAFAEHPNEALSRERILNLSQQRDWDPFDRSVDLRVMRVRKKIEPDPQRPQYIRTIRNAGYVFVVDGEQAT